jgi:methionyl-tRNA formyltransferase
MTLDKVLFVAALSPRSQAYAQAMKAQRMRVEKVILFSASNSTADTAEVPEVTNRSYLDDDLGIQIPDLNIPLKETCVSLADEVVELESDHINNDLILEVLRSSNPDLVIYSGYGGQIVSQDLLRIAPFLHIHAGWLPQYRGSTTIYYSILKEKICGVSAILLESEIDTGAIVVRRKFPLPTADMDVDHGYDGAIRASVLIEALEEWSEHGSFMRREYQSDSDSETYYVIHPVLKHLALLSLPARQ